MSEFDLASFANHLLAVEVGLMKRAETALDKSAKAIADAARAEIGYYQPAVGPYPEWPQLTPATLDQHAAAGVGDTPLLVHGELYASISHETANGEAVAGSTSEIMVYQEFGTDKIPPRPVVGPAEFATRERVSKIMHRGLADAIAGGNALLD
ncbi:hypothetical protein GJ699_02605 [Duganella sp. FT80W]|uniref:HK97 gp10 family phage protein n=1 Tax=Duganella guangzhouensis TaxID=2666084 RepID=A0A6I2KXX7_9BURK|nr:HK97-gp10 family putative phage morphogenesis protein [Duganella guangzhouensis]MRW88869.1 hypothetical protein [Duganella guangzhouensis]